MAITKQLTVVLSLRGDGTSTSFTVDVSKDPLPFAVSGTEIENLFTAGGFNRPVGAATDATTSHGVAASVSAYAFPVVTITLGSALAAGMTDNLGLYLLF